MSHWNDLAYPALESDYDHVNERWKYSLTGGLTKRELIAAMAMQGLLAGRQFSASEGLNVAHWAVEQADALLAALAEAKPSQEVGRG